MTITSNLRLYVDSVDRKDWDTYMPTGLFYGVTTNPKLLAQFGTPFEIDRLKSLAESAFDSGAKEIHLQVWGRGPDRMLEVGSELGTIDPRVMIKVPITKDGILCAKELIAKGLNVTLTAVHGAEQAIAAIALGAKYAAPYLGRMNDGGMDGLKEIIKMEKIIQGLDSPLRLLVASIRQISDLVILAEAGLNTFTLLPNMIEDLLKNDLTNLAADSFRQAVDGEII